jgi:5-methylcytosine-specific restriction protein A
MSRTVEEWRGKTDASAPPPRVKLRVFLRFGGTCQICFTKIVSNPEIDHQVALINGGFNCETNLVPLHPRCHALKTKTDVALKSADRKTQLHHYGIKQSRNPMPGSRRSKFKKKMSGEVVLR